MLNGHRHSYERIYPVYKGITEKTYNNPRAPVQIVNGAAGNREGHDFPFVEPAKDWSAYRNRKIFGYATIIVYNETHLDHSFYSCDTDQLLDYVMLYKKR